MNFDELFSKEQTVRAKYNGVDTIHYLRQPTPLEDLEFRRKCANVKVRNREILTSDAALNAPLNLYDKICQRVMVENGAGPEEVPDFKNKIPNDLKLAVIAAYQRRVEIDEGEVLGKLAAELDEYLGLKSAPKKETCPYGEPPDVEILSEEEWTINNIPRLEADHKCTLIISNADACATCPLADLSEEPKEPPSAFFQHLVFIADRQALGASFTYDTFSNLEWEGLKLLNNKRQEKTTRDLKARSNG